MEKKFYIFWTFDEIKKIRRHIRVHWKPGMRFLTPHVPIYIWAVLIDHKPDYMI